MSPGLAMAARASWRTRTSRAPTARSIRRSRRMQRGCAGCSASSASPAASRATSPRRPPVRFTKAVSWGMRSRTPTARRSTTPTCIVVLRRRRRRGGDRAAGRQLALEQVRGPSSRRRGAADPPPQRLQDREPHRAGPDPEPELRALLEGYGHSRVISWVATTPPMSTARWPRPSTRSSTRSPPSRTRRDGGTVTARARWPMIVLRTPKGWTGPKEVDGKPVEGTWRSHQVPMTDVRANGSSPARPRGVDAQLPPRGAVRRRRRAASRACSPSAEGSAQDERQSARQRRPAAARPAPPRLPRLRGRSCRPGATFVRGDPRARPVLCAMSSA